MSSNHPTGGQLHLTGAIVESPDAAECLTTRDLARIRTHEAGTEGELWASWVKGAVRRGAFSQAVRNVGTTMKKEPIALATKLLVKAQGTKFDAEAAALTGRAYRLLAEALNAYDDTTASAGGSGRESVVSCATGDRPLGPRLRACRVGPPSRRWFTIAGTTGAISYPKVTST